MSGDYEKGSKTSNAVSHLSEKKNQEIGKCKTQPKNLTQHKYIGVEQWNETRGIRGKRSSESANDGELGKDQHETNNGRSTPTQKRLLNPSECS